MEEQKRLFRRHILISAILSFLFIILILFLQHHRIMLLAKMDWFFYDRYFRRPHAVSGRVGVVLMDEQSARELGRRRSGWSRAQMAEAVRNLTAAGAEIIGLDVIYASPETDEAQDRKLAAAIHESGRVVLARYLPQRGREENMSLALFQEGMAGDGFIDFFEDRDNVLRTSPFFYLKSVEEGWEPIPSFALELVRAFKSVEFIPDFSLPKHILLGRAGSSQIRLPKPELRIFYYGGAERFKPIAYADAVRNRFDSAAVKGKIILIGSSIALEKDFFNTPVSVRKKTSAGAKGEAREEFRGGTEGVVCHANAVETILNRAFIQRLDERWIAVLVIWGGLFGMVFYFQRPGPLWGTLILFALSAGMLASADLLFSTNLLWIEIAPSLSVLGLQFVGGLAMQRVYAKKQTGLITDIFGKYVSRSVVDDILKNRIDVSLEGRSREVTVFFSDLRDFTTLAENLGPRETSRLLNRFFDAMLPIVLRYGGTLDKLIGDAIMAYFGAPQSMADHPQKAAETALAVRERLALLQKESGDSGAALLKIGIGLNSGPVTVGNLGSSRFMNYTVIGDTVNLGSRLESLNKHYNTTVILSEFTACKLDGQLVLRELDLVRVKGKMDAVRIYELVGFREKLDRRKRDLINIFEQGLRHYRNQEWEGAWQAFSQALAIDPQDGPSVLYQERTREFSLHPPGRDWSPIISFNSK